MPTGFHPGRIGGQIFRSLDDHARQTGHGIALPDNVGFAVPELTSGAVIRPDAAYFVGRHPRTKWTSSTAHQHSRSNYAARAIMATRPRGDGREAEPITSKPARSSVWDVDPIAGCVPSTAVLPPTGPDVFGRGQVAGLSLPCPAGGWQSMKSWRHLELCRIDVTPDLPIPCTSSPLARQ